MHNGLCAKADTENCICVSLCFFGRHGQKGLFHSFQQIMKFINRQCIGSSYYVIQGMRFFLPFPGSSVPFDEVTRILWTKTTGPSAHN